MNCTTKYCFSHVSIFQNLQQEEFEQISKMISRRVYNRGDYIAMAGDMHKMLFIIRKGQVKIVKPMPDGNEQIVRIAGAGDFFGDTVVFNDLPLSTNIEALEETHICMIPGEEFKRFLHTTPTILFKIIKEISTQVDNISTNISEICHLDVESRVASFLVKQMDLQQIATITLSKKDIASYLGTTRESVSRKLSEFQRAEFIRVQKGCIEILDRAALLEVANKLV